MASTTAMFTGLSGLNANARMLDVVGNNIANVNTTAYKSNRILFASQFSRTLSLGSEPSDLNGGANPAQIGLGVAIAGTQRNFSSGSLFATGDARDLAIEGDGLFIVRRGQSTFYTRAGAFRQDSANNLITVTGERVQGYAVDQNFNIIDGTLTTLNIPVGQLPLVQQTANVRLTGNFNTEGPLPSRGTRTNLAALLDLSSAPATPSTLLTAIDDPNAVGSQALFSVGQYIEVAGVQKGAKELPARRFQIGAASTVQDFMDFLRDALGIVTAAGNNPDGTTPGVTIDSAGVISIIGNTGSINDITITPSNIRHLDSNAMPIGGNPPFTPTKISTADGESVRTTFITYDSLGNRVSVDLSVVLEARTGGVGTTWRYFLASPDNTSGSYALPSGTGLLNFNTAGVLDPGTPPISASIVRDGSGAVSPMSFSILFNSPGATVGAMARPSELAMFSQDGAPVGVLASYAVGQDGVITGSFTNGLTRTIGQIAVAKFSNAEGLVDVGNNLFVVGPASGNAVITAPTRQGAGRIVGGALEQSNVDLAQEFINMIQASTGYSAASRVITTTDQLIQQLLVLGR
jgi:flagellar hook protein FlgE